VSFSQFDKKVTIHEDGEAAKSAPGKIRLKVGGPLELEPKGRYLPPAVVRILIVHSAKGDHDPANAARGSGVVVVDEFTTGRWETKVEVDEQAFRSEGETRGIGVAVLEQKDGFAFETITWCDHIELDLDVSASGEQSAT
jgi:hypothetical protein